MSFTFLEAILILVCFFNSYILREISKRILSYISSMATLKSVFVWKTALKIGLIFESSVYWRFNILDLRSSNVRKESQFEWNFFLFIMHSWHNILEFELHFLSMQNIEIFLFVWFGTLQTFYVCCCIWSIFFFCIIYIF